LKSACIVSGLRSVSLIVWPLAETEFSCYKIDMEIKLTAVFRKFPEGYAAFVEELPGANTQGATLEEARENLKEAVAMVLQANRELAEESLRGAEVVREPLALTTA
jgi:predicted RNase H-like HicB family nuclease